MSVLIISQRDRALTSYLRLSSPFSEKPRSLVLLRSVFFIALFVLTCWDRSVEPSLFCTYLIFGQSLVLVVRPVLGSIKLDTIICLAKIAWETSRLVDL